MYAFFWILIKSQYYLIADLIRCIFLKKKSDFFTVEKKLVDDLQIHFAKISEQSLDKKTKIVLCNHRTFADFFIDSYLCKGAGGLSRWLLAFVLPGVGLYGLVLNRVVFFHRGHTLRQKLIGKIENYFQKTQKPLIVYPEGTRYLGKSPIALKHGLLKSCFEKKWPCQILMTASKEEVINENKMQIQKGLVCDYAFSQVIDPSFFESYEDFYQGIFLTWSNLWSDVITEKDFWIE